MSTIGRYIQLSLKKMFTYRMNMVSVIIDTVIDCFSIWLFWKSIMELELNLATWNDKYIYLFIGYSMIFRSVYTIFSKCWDLQKNIIQGTLDIYLVRPGNPVVMILLENVNCLRIFLSFGIGIIILMIHVERANFFYSCIAIIVCIIASICMGLIKVIVYECSFFFRKMDSIAEIVETVFTVTDYPIILFGKNFVLFFTFIIPAAFVATIPTTISVQGMNDTNIIAVFIAFGILLLISTVLWKVGRNVYESTN